MQNEVIAVIAKQLGIKPETIKPEHRIAEDLGADSLDIIDMLFTLEEKHGVTIPDDVALNLKTVADIAKFLGSVQPQ